MFVPTKEETEGGRAHPGQKGKNACPPCSNFWRACPNLQSAAEGTGNSSFRRGFRNRGGCSDLDATTLPRGSFLRLSSPRLPVCPSPDLAPARSSIAFSHDALFLSQYKNIGLPSICMTLGR